MLNTCVVQGDTFTLLPNHSVHLLRLIDCTCSDLNFVKSFKNVKYLFLFKLGLEQKFRSIPGFRQSFYSILSSLRFLKSFIHEILGTLSISRDGLVLSPKGTTIEEVIRDDFIEDPAPDCLHFETLDQFIQYASLTE